MRILKYLFLLLLLSLVALTIFVATQKGSFTVERTKIINSPRTTVYAYVNDLQNWEDWNSLAVEDSLLHITHSQKTVGNGSLCSWNGNEGEGYLQTISTTDNTAINQKMNLNGNTANLTMTFKDTIGGTKVSWKAKGEMSFSYKLLNAINDGAEKTFGLLFEKSLVNLDQKLDYEINTYSIKVNGITNKTETYYLAQSFTSEFSTISKNIGIVVSKISHFCTSNNISISGKPFVIYHTYDEINKITKLSICIPIKSPIFISEGSDILSRTLRPFQAVKTTLTGDYSHKDEALVKTSNYINQEKLIKDPKYSRIEILTIGKNDVKKPSKWITEIYYPLQQKAVAKPVIALPVKVETPVPPANNENELPSEF